jgi:lysyl-tRNA synthetase, class II
MTDHPAPEARTNAEGDDDGVPEQVRIRRAKRSQLIAQGVAPYPLGVPRTHTLREIRDRFESLMPEPDAATGEVVSVAGRVIFLRNTGKLCFARLREGDGTEIQVMLSLGDVGERSLADFKSVVDIGDLISATGEVVTSRRGELSIRCRSWQLAAKALRPLPVDHKRLSDEARVRQRYLDLIIRPEARSMVRARATVLGSLRSTLNAADFVEVETPILQLTNGGAAARPFRTHLNTFDQVMLLRIALELDLKRAMIGGIDRVYEIGRTFRNEGIDSTHAAEFTMLEAYQAYTDYHGMAELSQRLVVDAAIAVGSTVVAARDGSKIELESEWRRAGILDLVSETIDTEISLDDSVGAMRELAARHNVAVQAGWDAGQIIVELYEKLVEHTLLRPTFVMDFPESVKPLAKAHRTRPGLVEAFDLVINGVELVAAYSELNDPVVQRERLVQQSLEAAAGNPEAMDLDEVFLRAMEYGMPPAGGLGMGVDRLMILLTGAAGIRDTMLFPLLRPE